MLATSIRKIAPPVKPVDQKTEFAANDVLLIDDSRAGMRREMVVTVEHVNVREYQVRPDLIVRSVWYTISYEGDGKPFGNGCRVIGEVALKRAFRAYVWQEVR